MPDSLTHEQRDLIERFVTAYNRIDKHFRKRLEHSQGKSFSFLVKDYAFRHRDILMTFANLRNVIVHEQTQPNRYLAVPLKEVVGTIEKINEELANPRTVIPHFQQTVKLVSIDTQLAAVL